MEKDLAKLRNIKSLPKQFTKYLLVGGFSALGELLLFTLFVRGIHLSIILANIIAVLAATVGNFILNRNWSFKSQAKLTRSFVLYLILFSFNLAFSTYAIHFLINLGLVDVIAKLITMILITLWNFVLYRKVIFLN